MPIHSAMGDRAKYLLSDIILLKESGIIVDRSVRHSNLFSINVAESPAVQFLSILALLDRNARYTLLQSVLFFKCLATAVK